MHEVHAYERANERLDTEVRALRQDLMRMADEDAERDGRTFLGRLYWLVTGK